MMSDICQILFSEKKNNLVINEATDNNDVKGIVQAHSARKDDKDDDEDDFKLKLKPFRKYFFNVGEFNIF